MNVIHVVLNSVRLLPMQRDSARPIVQLFMLGPLRGGSLKNHGHGPALLQHESVKPVRHVLCESVVTQGHGVIEVQNSIGGLVEVIRPVVGGCLMQHEQSLFIEHRPPDVSNQVLHLNRRLSITPSQQCSFIQLADGIGPRYDFGRKRSREEDHAVHGAKRRVIQAAEHRLFDKGLDVSARLW